MKNKKKKSSKKPAAPVRNGWTAYPLPDKSMERLFPNATAVLAASPEGLSITSADLVVIKNKLDGSILVRELREPPDSTLAFWSRPNPPYEARPTMNPRKVWEVIGVVRDVVVKA